MTQQARQLMWKGQEAGRALRFLLHDRDVKFSTSFDDVFASEGIEVILTPYRAPNANAYAERWVRSVREECLDYRKASGKALRFIRGMNRRAF